MRERTIRRDYRVKMPEPAQTNGRTRIVIVGGGFSGAYCAAELDRKLRGKNVDVLLINGTNYFVFYPLLVECGTGALQPRNALVSLRSFFRHGRFMCARATKIDVHKREVTVRVGEGLPDETIQADHLVLALGSVTLMPPIPGLRDHAFEMKSLADAISLRDRAIHMLELASFVNDDNLRRELLHFVVVGGSFTGVETAGEFHAYMKKAARFYPRLDPSMVRMTIIDRGDRLLKALDPRLSEYTRRHFERRGIDVKLGRTITHVEARSCTLDDGSTLATRTVIWAAGVAPHPLIASIDVPTERGWIVCEPDGRIKGFNQVWGVGDCAANPDPTGKPYPATAQHAVREGKHAARMIANTLRGLKTEPLVYKTQGSLAAFGRFDAVAQVAGIRIAGFLAWFMWRTVYLMKMPGIVKRIQVALDWTVDFLPRDYVELGVHRVRRANPAEPSAMP